MVFIHQSFRNKLESDKLARNKDILEKKKHFTIKLSFLMYFYFPKVPPQVTVISDSRLKKKKQNH